MKEQKDNNRRFPSRYIFLELTNACNFRCDFCPIDQQSREKAVMPTEFARRIIDQIAEHNLTKLLYFHIMGEPFLHKHMCLLVGYAEERGLNVCLLTNGSLLESKRNLELFKNGLTRLEVSFRTPNENSFNARLRGTSLTLTEYIQRVQELISDKIQTKAATEISIKFFIRSYAAAAKLGDPYGHLTDKEANLKIARSLRSHTLETAKKNSVSTYGWQDLPIRIVNGEYPIFPGVYIGFGRIQDFWVREQRGDRKTGYPAFLAGCSDAFRNSFGILASGEVTTCCVDYDGRNVIGDLRNQSLMEVLGSDQAKRIRRSFKWCIPPTPFCRECKGGPTFISSIMKQASSVFLDLRDRIASRYSL